MARSSRPRDRSVTLIVTLCDSESSVVITTMDAEQATASQPVDQTTTGNVKKQKQKQDTRQSDKNSKPKPAKAPQDANGSNQSQKRQQSSKQRGLPRDSPQVRLSKTVSWLLRHGAASEGLSMRSDGYVKVTDLVCAARNQRYLIAEAVW